MICESESEGPVPSSSSAPPKVKLPLALPVSLFISVIMAVRLPPRSRSWSLSLTASRALQKFTISTVLAYFHALLTHPASEHPPVYRIHLQCFDCWRSPPQPRWRRIHTRPPATTSYPASRQSHSTPHGYCVVPPRRAASDRTNGQSGVYVVVSEPNAGT